MLLHDFFTLPAALWARRVNGRLARLFVCRFWRRIAKSAAGRSDAFDHAPIFSVTFRITAQQHRFFCASRSKSSIPFSSVIA